MDLWTAAPWGRTPAPKPVCQALLPDTATANPVLTKAPSPAAPAPILVLMRNVQADTINPAASPVMTGMPAHKPAPPSAQALINIPVPAPVTPAAPVQPAAESILPVVALLDTYGA